jgi:molybdopterin/thiamine biosynthesis adenylyltransferase
MKKAEFNYDEAFSCNIGWLTRSEQYVLRIKRVAIVGMGGVGGAYLLALARFGIGAFTICDFDHFEVKNFNRQVGANLATVGRRKNMIMEESVRLINPELSIKNFDEPISLSNIDEFLRGADLFIDAIDFFEMDMRRALFRRCAELGIPAMTANPIGMGTAYMVFLPKGIRFDDYFAFGQNEKENYLLYLHGLAPKRLQRPYLIDPSSFNLSTKKGASTIAGCQLSAGVIATEAVKALLGRGISKPAPYSHQFDAYRMRYVSCFLKKGNRDWWQKLKFRQRKRQAAGWSSR